MSLVPVKVLLTALCFVRVGTVCGDLLHEDLGLAYHEGFWLVCMSIVLILLMAGYRVQFCGMKLRLLCEERLTLPWKIEFAEEVLR